MAHVVILGAGIAGVSAAYALKSRLGPDDTVTVVSDKPYFHFVPSNPWVAMGWRERADVAFPIGPYLESRGIRFISSGVRCIQPDIIQVDLENGNVLFYDHLLVATGAAALADEVPGMAEHTHSVVHIDQAERALAAYRAFVRHPGPIVIGAAAGASGLGPLYEYAFLIDADLRQRKLREQVPITLVTPEPWPGHLGLGGEGTRRSVLAAALADTGIKVVCNALTTRIDRDTIHVTELGATGSARQTHALPHAYSAYWPALGGVRGVRSAGDLVDARGLMVVDEYLRSPEYPNVFALGACVAQPSAEFTPVALGASDSVYSIQRAVEIAVHNILADLTGAPPLSHARQRARWLSDLGTTGAAYLSEPQVPLRDINWLRQGRWVHQAKVDFEKYFVNTIRLHPTGQVDAATSSIAAVMTRAFAEKNCAHGSAAVDSTPAAQTLEIRLPHDPGLELRALAQSLGRAPEALAGALLAAAVSDAKSYLDPAVIDAMAHARRALLVAGLPECQPGFEFREGGI